MFKLNTFEKLLCIEGHSTNLKLYELEWPISVEVLLNVLKRELQDRHQVAVTYT